MPLSPEVEAAYKAIENYQKSGSNGPRWTMATSETNIFSVSCTNIHKGLSAYAQGFVREDTDTYRWNLVVTFVYKGWRHDVLSYGQASTMEEAQEAALSRVDYTVKNFQAPPEWKLK